jgi:PAS domain S-box-containing protein
MRNNMKSVSQMNSTENSEGRMNEHISPTVEHMECLEKKLAALEAHNARLTAENILLRQLYERAPLSYQSLDENGCFLSVNQAWLDALGYSQEEVVGHNFGDFLHPDWQDHFKENFPRFKAVGEILGVEFEMRKKDGSFVYVSFNGRIGKDPRGNFQQTYCIFQDITLQKQAEAALIRSQEKWRNIIVSVPLIGISLDPGGRILFANTHFLQVVGWEEHEVLGRDWFDLFVPDHRREQVRTVFLTAMQQRNILDFANYEYEIVTRTGKLRNVAWCNVLNKDIHNNILDATCLGVDLTERIRAMAALRESEERHRTYINNMPYGVFVTDQQGRYCQVNPATCQITGYTEQELLAMNIADLLTENSLEEGSKHFQRLVQESTSQNEMLYRTKNGEIKWWSVTTVKISENRFLGFCNDISDRKRSEDILHSERQTFELILEQSLAGYWDWLIQEKTEYLSPSFKSMFGYADHELPNSPDTWLQLIYPEDLPGVFDTFNRHVASRGTVPYYNEIRYRHKTGATVWVICTGKVIEWDAQGNAVRMIGCHIDITERKRIEEALRESEARFKALHNASFGGITIHDKGRILECNQGLAEITGFSVAELIGMDGLLLIAPRSRDLVRANILAGYEHPYEALGLRKNGEEYPLRLEAKNIPYRGQQVRVVEFRDITAEKENETERERLQMQLLQAQKMESVGRLAGGIAHDFNNMLGVILGRTEIAQESVDPSLPLYTDLEHIHKAAVRSANLTRQLLAFARKQTIAPKILDFNEVVSSMLNMVQRLIGEDIDLVWLPKANLWEVKMDPSQLDQILANLCVNARDAIAGVGKITIETENSTFDARYCAAHQGYIPGDYVQLALSDNGCGIDVETLNHIFEPFFTTKETGKGTGLGLATVYGIVKQNNGFINVYSEPAQGTTFRIYLPRHRATTAFVADNGTAQPVKRGDETILLVEDEAAILEMTTTMLERLGYHILPASTPGEALALAESFNGTISLLLTDVVMPGMNGRDLARQIVALHPNITPLFMSGYTANVIAHHGVLDTGVQFLEKPFSKKDLASKIRDALNQHPPTEK